MDRREEAVRLFSERKLYYREAVRQGGFFAGFGKKADYQKR
jgi:hypothetical protein